MSNAPQTRKERAERVTLLHLAANKPAAIAGRRGTVVACLAGVLWVTLDGDVKDYTVSRGRKFLCGRTGALVINSLNDSGVAMVYEIELVHGHTFTGGSVCEDFDSRARLVHVAHEQRAAAFNALAYWISAQVRRGWCSAKRKFHLNPNGCRCW